MWRSGVADSDGNCQGLVRPIRPPRCIGFGDWRTLVPSSLSAPPGDDFTTARRFERSGRDPSRLLRDLGDLAQHTGHQFTFAASPRPGLGSSPPPKPWDPDRSVTTQAPAASTDRRRNAPRRNRDVGRPGPKVGLPRRPDDFSDPPSFRHSPPVNWPGPATSFGGRPHTGYVAELRLPTPDAHPEHAALILKSTRPGVGQPRGPRTGHRRLLSGGQPSSDAGLAPHRWQGSPADRARRRPPEAVRRHPRFEHSRRRAS